MACDVTSREANGAARPGSQKKQNDPDGIRINADSKGNIEVLTESDAKSGALSDGADRDPVDRGDFDPDLVAVVEAWGDLPQAVRAGIVAMVRATRGMESVQDAESTGIVSR